MENGWTFADRVAQGEDGAYRWRYDMKAHGNDDLFWSMVGICAAVAAPVALVMLMLTWPYGAAQALLWTGILLAIMVLLPALIWKLSPPNPCFCMDEMQIETWPKGRGRNLHSFGAARRVTMAPDRDLIKLSFRLGAVRVYAPPEDYAFVREYILARVPETAEILY